MIRYYSHLKKLRTFEDRFNYLKLSGKVGEETFGVDRYLNQILYRSSRWREVRRNVIVRDLGLDLGCDDYPILGKIMVHHMNPVTIEQVSNLDDDLFDMNYLISTSFETHEAIHYGNKDIIPRLPFERSPGDTKLW